MAGSGTLLEERRETLRNFPTTPTVNGIDRIEVAGADRRVVVVHLVHPAPGEPGGVPAGGAPITLADIDITGGDIRRGLQAISLTVSGDRLEIELDRSGDFSVYILHILRDDFDPILKRAAFGFRADCPDVFDPCATGVPDAQELDGIVSTYLAKDYESFRRFMLDRLAVSTPDWQETAVPDTGLTLVELLAHYADLLSYRQDIVANEAYIGTARLRTSLRRHVRLLGYSPFEGTSARAFVHLRVSGPGSISHDDLRTSSSTPLLPDEITSTSDVDLERLTDAGAVIFEPLPIQYVPSRYDKNATDTQLRTRTILYTDHDNSLPVHDWGDIRAVLQKGATEAWLRGDEAATRLRKGDFVLFEQVRDPDTTLEGDADPVLRQVVQLVRSPEAASDPLSLVGGSPRPLIHIEWHTSDALAFDLPIGHLAPGDPDTQPCAVARGNMVLCDHGVRLSEDGDAMRSPPAPPEQDDVSGITSLSELDVKRRFRPLLRYDDIASRTRIDFAPDPEGVVSILDRGSRITTPEIEVEEDVSGTVWRPVNSMVDADDDDRVFVPESEDDGRTYLRFAQADSYGQEFPDDTAFRIRYRVGKGPAGNVGADTLTRAITDDTNIISVRNPLPASGGLRPESAASLRANALATLKINERAVTREDYVERAKMHPIVSQAYARTIWHGSWSTISIAVDLADGRALTDGIRSELEAFIEPYRLMGQDVRIEEPRYAPLDIVLHVCISQGYREADVLSAVNDALSDRRLGGGRLGYFHPDRLTFGQNIYLSRIYEAVYAVAGVTDVKVVRFSRLDRPDESFLESGVFKAPDGEIPILSGDRNRRGQGRLKVLAWR